MARLTRALNAWGTPGFNDVLRREIERLDGGLLPLQQGLSAGSHALLDDFQATILGTSREAGLIRARAGIFYRGVIAGCNCADDPSPADDHEEYCEIQLDIDERTGEAVITLLAE